MPVWGFYQISIIRAYKIEYVNILCIPKSRPTPFAPHDTLQISISNVFTMDICNLLL